MELSEEIKATKDIIQAFLKTKKMIRMYPPNNPIYVKTLEDCYSKFKNFNYYKDLLVLKIKQNEILYDSEQVYSSSEKEDNLALFFFKDGLREITFRQGLTSEELEEFLKIISLDYDREVVDDDLVTMLWEKDFQNIQYIVDDAVLADEEDYEAKAVAELEEKATEEDDLHKAYEDAFKKEGEIKEVSIVPLTDNDLQLLSDELTKDSQEKIGKLNNVLFELLYIAETLPDYSEVIGFFMNSIDYSIRRGDIQMVTNVMAKMKQIIDDKSAPEDVKKHAKRVILFAGSDQIVSLIGEILDSGHEMEEKIFEDFIKFLDKGSIMPFMKILGELNTIHSRKIVIDALIFLGPKDIMTLATGLNDSRWYVVRNIIYILRKIGDKRAVDYLLRTVKHGDIRVKKEVIRTLGELGGAGVIKALKDCLDDPELQVRSAALRAFGNIASEAAKRIIMDRISDKYFRDKDFEEKKEYFEVLARWKDNEVYNLLMEIMKKSTFWGRSKSYEDKACAAYCLGLIGNKEALTILNKFKNSSNNLLREYIYSAIHRLEHGQ